MFGPEKVPNRERHLCALPARYQGSNLTQDLRPGLWSVAPSGAGVWWFNFSSPYNLVSNVPRPYNQGSGIDIRAADIADFLTRMPNNTPVYGACQ